MCMSKRLHVVDPVWPLVSHEIEGVRLELQPLKGINIATSAYAHCTADSLEESDVVHVTSHVYHCWH